MPSPPTVAIVLADLADERHQQAVLDLLDMYARDPLGNNQPLAGDVRRRLLPGLQAQTNGRYFLACSGETAVGVAICFVGFSTFYARPLINIHDLAVLPEYRGRGVGRSLLEAIEQEARRLNCCKITLEVRADNHAARQAYLNFGFDPGQPQSSAMSFWTKKILG